MTKLEQAARQALEALEFNNTNLTTESAITALREALAEPKLYNHETGSVLIPNPLAEQAEQEPVAEVVLRNQTVGFGRTEERKDVMFLADVDVGTKLYAKSQQQTEQEPVAWGYFDADGSFMDALDRQHGAYQTPLYAAPVQQDTHATHVVRTKDPCHPWQDLTDDEIVDVMNKIYGSMWTEQDRDFARAVIAADMEKNNANNNT